VIDPEMDLRYTVRVEVSASMDGFNANADDDRDELLEIHEILERMEDIECGEIADDVYQQLRYDLCPECYKKFIASPVGREPVEQFGFSKN
jgi:NAD-dependent SIR2 family protein deacetylase